MSVQHIKNSERFFLTSPHSGEAVPPEVTWLKDLPEEIVMFDIDRYVDRLYEKTAQKINVPFICAKWHRYFADPNRFPEDVDEASVIGSKNPKGKFTTGLLWQQTSQGHVLMKEPISKELHQKLVKDYYMDFHSRVVQQYEEFFKSSSKSVYQLDLHSMPSLGTAIHRDPGETRAEIVISDQKEKSASKEFVQLTKEAFLKAGFQVGYNWPYFGGRVTETYGHPDKNQHCIQVELRRDLYMDELTKKIKNESFLQTQIKLDKAIEYVYQNIDALKNN